MKADSRIIHLLNQVLKKELTGVNQYFIHAKMCQAWGYGGALSGDPEGIHRGDAARR